MIFYLRSPFLIILIYYFRFCFEVPHGCLLDPSPIVVVPSHDFPYHGIALGKTATEFKKLKSLQSMESALLEALQQESKLRGHSLPDATPSVTLRTLPSSTEPKPPTTAQNPQ